MNSNQGSIRKIDYMCIKTSSEGEWYFSISGIKSVTVIVYRRELYLAVLITCLERFESYFEISCSGFVFILWINFIFVTRLAQFFILKKKPTTKQKKKKTNPEKTLPKDQIHLRREKKNNWFIWEKLFKVTNFKNFFRDLWHLRYILTFWGGGGGKHLDIILIIGLIEVKFCMYPSISNFK